MNWKKIGQRLLFPPVWLIVILSVASAGALVYVFGAGLHETAFAYGTYVASFYTLSVACIFLGRTLPKQYGRVKRAIYLNPVGNRYLTDVEFKNHVSLFGSLAVNLLYVGTNVFSAFLYRSVWFAIFAGYYMILAVMRFLLAAYIQKNGLGKRRVGELKCSRICAVILMTINLVLTGAVPMMLYRDRGFEYHGMLIYVMAMYAFYMTGSAIVELIKYRKYNNPILSMAKVIKMATALVSMLSLETAMLSRFGEKMPPEDQRIMIAATGAGISLIVAIMAVYMIVRTTKEIKTIRR